MKKVRSATDAAGFEPFGCRGWSFLCCCVPDGQGRFRPVVFSELCWPGGMPVVQSSADAFATTELARRHARKIATAWVKQRAYAAAQND
ncbi:hypothetical protein VLK31_30530 [Variovorax sp. H27-G14]|uniref:hypothetical protein n=1 Tax=Variovorax sp. H27-G14 TaxID=3111914 RepID=UPI0038FCD6A9